MNIKPITKAHLDLVNGWLSARSLELPREYPAIGFIAYEGTYPIAAGFLRLVEGGTAILDSLVTNPAQSSELRSKSIDLVVENLIKKGKELGLSGIIAYTIEPNVLRRSTKHGFQELPHKVISVKL